jgi:hypothetical protein
VLSECQLIGRESRAASPDFDAKPDAGASYWAESAAAT